MTPSLTMAARITAIAAVATIAAGALAGCTDSGTTKANTTHTPKPSASSTALAPGVTKITDTPGSGEGLVGALADSKTTKCALDGKSWTVSGTVTNPTTATVHYRIYVSLLNGGGSTRALQQVDVDRVRASATADWSATIGITETGLSCVLRVERYNS